MTGGDGHDRLYVDAIGDRVVEANGFGTGIDTVRTSVSYSLVGQFVERMQLLGTASINAVGNSLANVLTGNAGNNRLDGRGGIDAMDGGAGDDTYFVDHPLDRVREANEAGTDLVFCSVSKSFSNQFIERITMTGGAPANTTGNLLANSIVGNDAQNALNGGDGRDRLTGMGGDDAFVFRSPPGRGNVDIVTDFAHAPRNDDTIKLDNAVFRALPEGPLAAGAFQSNATGLATRADDRIIFETDRGRVYYDTNGSAGGGNFLLAVLKSDGDFATATRADFLII
jgi:Ca2+-binding RTX toxin-like protein